MGVSIGDHHQHDIYISWHSYCIMAAILFNHVSGFLFLAISEISESFTQKCSLKNYSKKFRQIHKNRPVSMFSLNKVARYTPDKKTPPDDYFWTLKAWNKTLKLLLCSLGFFYLIYWVLTHVYSYIRSTMELQLLWLFLVLYLSYHSRIYPLNFLTCNLWLC